MACRYPRVASRIAIPATTACATRARVPQHRGACRVATAVFAQHPPRRVERARDAEEDRAEPRREAGCSARRAADRVPDQGERDRPEPRDKSEDDAATGDRPRIEEAVV